MGDCLMIIFYYVALLGLRNKGERDFVPEVETSGYSFSSLRDLSQNMVSAEHPLQTLKKTPRSFLILLLSLLRAADLIVTETGRKPFFLFLDPCVEPDLFLAQSIRN
jgi:hypothetical protein